MRNPNRIDGFCEVIKEVWKTVPDWRFGQLMSNILGDIYVKSGNRDIFFIEDDEMEEFWKEYLPENKPE